MSMYMPGNFFIGALTPTQQGFIKNILIKAKESGYTKIVEPCAGAFAMSHLAIQAGFKPEQIESSDITLFSTIYGYAIMGKELDDLEIKADGFTKRELKDHATALFAQIFLKTANASSSDFFYSILRDMELNKKTHIKKIREQLERSKEILHGMNYRALDMNVHMQEVESEEKTIIIVNPPTYKAGYEKWFDTKGKVNWKECEYGIFDPKTGLQEMMDRAMGTKAIVLCYEEAKAGEYKGIPMHVRNAVRDDINVYITTNLPDQVLALSGKIGVERKIAKELKPLNVQMFPVNGVITEKSKIHTVAITPQEAYYYRSLWMNKFVGSSAQVNIALYIDNKIAGVFGYQLAIGKTLKRVLIWYGVTKKINNYRLNRLLTMVASNLCTVQQFVPENKLRGYAGISTSNLTKHPESKLMRGIMKLVNRKKGKLGYTLVYECDFQIRSNEETVIQFLNSEKEWKAKKQQPKVQVQKKKRRERRS